MGEPTNQNKRIAMWQGTQVLGYKRWDKKLMDWQTFIWSKEMVGRPCPPASYLALAWSWTSKLQIAKKKW